MTAFDSMHDHGVNGWFETENTPINNAFHRFTWRIKTKMLHKF